MPGSDRKWCGVPEGCVQSVGNCYSVWALPAVCGRCQQCVGVVRGEWVWFYVSWSVIEFLGVTGSGVEYRKGLYSEWVIATVCGQCQQCVGVASSAWAWSGVSGCGFR